MSLYNEIVYHDWRYKASLTDILSMAKAHAIEVCGRSHIKGARLDRVNHFITTLHRELPRICDAYNTALLTNKRLWYDACTLEVLNEYPYISHQKKTTPYVSLEELRTAVKEAGMMTYIVPEDEKIRQEMVDLKDSLAIQRGLIQELDLIDSRSEVVINRIADLYQELSSI